MMKAAYVGSPKPAKADYFFGHLAGGCEHKHGHVTFEVDELNLLTNFVYACSSYGATTTVHSLLTLFLGRTNI